MRVFMLSKACIVGIYQRKLELIAKQGVELMVAVPPSWRDERGEQKLERVYTEGYTLKQTPIRFNGNFHFHYYPDLPRLLSDFKPDIVHIDEEPYNAATWHALYHARRIGARSLFFTWQNIYRNYPLPFNWGESWVMHNVDAAIAGTYSASDVYRAKGFKKAIAVIPQFGTDPDLFAPVTQKSNRPFTIGYVGRLVEEKGLRLLVDAVSHLDFDWRLHLVGSGPLSEELKQLAEQLGITERITFTEWMPSSEMPSVYHDFDALVLPSLTRPNWKEQFGRVLVEAMASGVPVIGSDSGAIPFVVGDAGLIVPEGSADAIAELLQKLHDDCDLQQELAKKGRQRVLNDYTHASIAQATVDLYKGMMQYI
ncbi:MAG: glycosyltransferase family 4 protein [Anaerolineaceae bacterium]|nr:glycosyltransferase family 4 protein [Anaerolineaceae bacterium]